MTADHLPLTVLSHNGDSSGISRDRIARDLAAIIEGEVRFGAHERMLYATDASMYQVEPIGVVCPRTIADAEKVVRYCAQHNLPLLPRGAGTSLAGQAVNHAIIVDFSVSCRRVLEVDAARRTARVEPGVILDQLNGEAARHGLMFGPDVATSGQANIGGMIGNNSAGAHSILYGRTVEHLRGLEVIMADGLRLRLDEGGAERDHAVRDLTQRIANVIRPRESQIERRFPRTVRRVNGYNLDLILQQLRASTPGTFDRVNLAHLICGSEGTLALTLAAQLDLVPVPPCAGLAIVAFAGVDEALRALLDILETDPAAVELIDDVVIGLARRNVEYRRYVELLPQPPAGATGAVLYVEYFSDTPNQLHDRFQHLQSRFGNQSINSYIDAQSMAQAWKLRKAGEPLLHGLHGPRKPITFIEDTAVSPDRLAEFIGDFRTLVAGHGTTAAYYAHASVGCLHIRPMICLRDEGDLEIMQAIAEQAADLVIKYGGALSGEHGDGRARSHLLERFYGREICQAFADIKAIFDPHNRLNPGNIVQPAGMLDHLRVRPGQRFIQVPPVKTFFQYQGENGFGEAVELCNGAGVCRKMKGGTMCPSYRATLDERHATRGRGNALRLAITGQFSSDGQTPLWDDPETKKTLDLCLSCKACKSECPSNVDIAKLKVEYLAQGYARGAKIPLSSRVFSHIRFFNRIGSAIHPVANGVSRFGPVRSLAGRLINIHPKRALPRFQRSLYRWKDKRDRRKSRTHILKNVSTSKTIRAQDMRTVVLLPDCFTIYNEAHIGRAAVLTLEALGYRVVLPKLGCCGRAMISMGLLSQASKTCRQTAQGLMECVRQENAIAVVGCEPSCISAIKDEWLELEIGIDPASLRDLAGKTFLVEQFIEERWNDHPLPSKQVFQLPDEQIMLHGHCHQKALWGIESSSKILTRLLGDKLVVLDSGCCGMAGSFGYTRDHYEVSMKIGELSLFGRLREAPGALVLATGTSCRQQIHDGLQRQAMHPIELIARTLSVVERDAE